MVIRGYTCHFRSYTCIVWFCFGVVDGYSWLYIQICMAASHFSQAVFDCVLLMNAAHWAARTVGTKLRIHFLNFEPQLVQGET